MESILMSDLKSLTEKLNPVVWVLGALDNAGSFSTVTAFCVHEDGYIMTCAHAFKSEHPDLRFVARRIDKDEMKHTAKIVAQYKQWDITVLKLEGELSEYKAATFGSGLIHEGETVILIGHPCLLIGSVLVGHSLYRCVPNPRIPTTDMNCDTYVPAESSMPEYRILGQYRNKNNTKENSEECGGRLLHPLVPIIQTNGLCSYSGASGSPLFNAQGQIVGLHVSSIATNDFSISIHVSVLREALRRVLSEVDLKGKKHSRAEHYDFEAKKKVEDIRTVGLEAHE